MAEGGRRGRNPRSGWRPATYFPNNVIPAKPLRSGRGQIAGLDPDVRQRRITRCASAHPTRSRTTIRWWRASIIHSAAASDIGPVFHAVLRQPARDAAGQPALRGRRPDRILQLRRGQRHVTSFSPKWVNNCTVSYVTANPDRITANDRRCQPAEPGRAASKIVPGINLLDVSHQRLVRHHHGKCRRRTTRDRSRSPTAWDMQPAVTICGLAANVRLLSHGLQFLFPDAAARLDSPGSSPAIRASRTRATPTRNFCSATWRPGGRLRFRTSERHQQFVLALRAG